MAADYGPWAPWTLERIAQRFETAPFRWWVCGGLALELWMGRSWRSHDDIDVGILRRDVGRAAALLESCSLFVAAAGVLSGFTGQVLSAEKHENNVWARERSTNRWVLDLLLDDGDDRTWIYRRDPTIRRPWSATVLVSATGLPYLAPELQLLYKSAKPRPRDGLDAATVIPMLEDERRAFLVRSLPADHPWQAMLARA
jgi:hypothetical protein